MHTSILVLTSVKCCTTRCCRTTSMRWPRCKPHTPVTKIQGNESSGTTISKALVGRSACLKRVLECGFNNSLTATCRWKKSCSSRRDGTLMFWYECLFRSRKKFSVVEQWTIVYSIKWCYCMWFITTQKLMWTHPIAYLRERASNVCQMCVCARIPKSIMKTKKKGKMHVTPASQRDRFNTNHTAHRRLHRLKQTSQKSLVSCLHQKVTLR